jgi:hypothetical protein
VGWMEFFFFLFVFHWTFDLFYLLGLVDLFRLSTYFLWWGANFCFVFLFVFFFTPLRFFFFSL